MMITRYFQIRRRLTVRLLRIVFSLVFVALAGANHGVVIAAPPASLGGYDFDGDGVSDALRLSSSLDDNGASVSRVGVYSGATDAPLYFLQSGGVDDLYGYSLSGLGDLNHDGFDELVIGAPRAIIGGELAGAAYLYSGIDGSLLTSWVGPADSAFGQTVSSAGDFDGDGVPDIAIGINRQESLLYQGEVRIYSGVNYSPICTALSDTPNDLFGAAITSLGDIDGDGFDDIAVSAPLAVSDAGETGAVFVISGRAPGSGPVVVSRNSDALLLWNDDPEIVRLGIALLPTMDDEGASVDGIAVISVGDISAVGDPFSVTLIDLNAAVLEVQTFASVYPVGDVDISQGVDTGDVGLVIADFGAETATAGPMSTDINGDGIVETTDLTIVLGTVEEVGPLVDLAPNGPASSVGIIIGRVGCCIPSYDGACDGADPNEDCNSGVVNDDGGDIGGVGDGSNDTPDGGDDGGGGSPPSCTVEIVGAPTETVTIPCGSTEPLTYYLSFQASAFGTMSWSVAGATLTPESDPTLSAIEIEVAQVGEVQIVFTITSPNGGTCTDIAEFEVTKPCVDLDIDSDNNNGYEAPDGSDEEEEAEDGAGIKVLIVDRDDVNENGIPDYADGFGAFESGGTIGGAFVPITVSFDGILDTAGYSFSFEYDAADPDDVIRTEIPIPDIESSYFEYERGAGLLRLWSKDASEARVIDDYVAPGDEIDLAAFASTQTFYVEAVNGSATAVSITVTLTTANGGVLTDTVSVLPFDSETGLDEPEILGFSIFNGSTQGTPGNDFVFGTDSDDIIFTGDGDDIIIAGDGDDVINAGADFDVVYAWKGYDDITLDDGSISGRDVSRFDRRIRRAEGYDTTEPLMHAYSLIFGADDRWMSIFLDDSLGGKVSSVKPRWYTSMGDLESHKDELGNVDYIEIQIEFNPEKPLKAAARLREELVRSSNALVWRGYRDALQNQYEELYLQNADDEEDAVISNLIQLRTDSLSRAAALTSSMGYIYVSGLSVFSEAADIVITVSELTEGNYAAAIGFLPLVPATVVNSTKVTLKTIGGAVRDIEQIGRVTRFKAHGLGWIDRKGMANGIVPHSNGYTFKLGTAQNTTHLPGDNHAAIVDGIATSIAQSGDADYVIMNRSLRTCTGLDAADLHGQSRRLPDVFYMDRNTNIGYLVEVQSPSQSLGELEDKLLDMKNAFPPEFTIHTLLYDVAGVLVE